MEKRTEFSSYQDLYDYFKEIPDKEWTTGAFYEPITGACCALGHIGVGEHVRTNLRMPSINGVQMGHKFLGELMRHNDQDGLYPNPKKRTLAFISSYITKPALSDPQSHAAL